MIWPLNISNRSRRESQVFLWALVQWIVCLMGSGSMTMAQNAAPDSLLIFRFLKEYVELTEAGTYFNVLEIKNNDNKTISGLITFNAPDGWKFIGPAQDTLSLQSGASKMIPLRVSIPRSTLGGISYVLGAELFGKDLYNYANAYISIEKRSRWDMRLTNTQLFFSDYKPVADLTIRLNNKGNTNELVKLSFDMGGLLEFREKPEADSLLFIDLPAYMDTIISLSLQQRRELSYAEEQAMKQSWKSKSLGISASTADRNLYGSVRADFLENKTINKLPMRNSPLNTEVTLYNLLSQHKKKAVVRLYGKVLFPDDQQLSYSLGYYNLYFDPAMNREVDIYQQIRYMIKYTDRNSLIWLGDRLGVGQLHTLTGRGVRASHQFNDRNSFQLNVVQNPYARNIGGFLGYEGYIGSVGWNTGLTLETTTNNTYGHYSFHLGGIYKIMQKHSVSLQTATTISRFGEGRYLDRDTTTVGVAYRLTYRYSGKRFMIRVDNSNTQLSYLRNSGINRIYVNGRFIINDRMRVHGRYDRQNYTSSRYPYLFFNPPNTNLNENARLIYSFNVGKITYQAGPQYSGAVRNYYYVTGDYSTRYTNYQPGLLGSVSFRLSGMRSITPNFAFSSMFYSFDSDQFGDLPTEYMSNWTYTLGLNYYDQAFKLNAYYTTGEATDVYRSVVIQDDPVINQAFHIRPYYERYFFKETIRLSAFFNYSYYMPSLRENMLVNLTGNVFVGDSWDLFASFNIYRISRNDVDVGRLTSRDVNLMVGFRKAFDIQQPRLSYYDLTIIGFNDLDGDGRKDRNEKPISNVLINISRDPSRNEKNRTGFAETSMVTDPNGEIFYGNLPEGTYDLTIFSLSNLEDLYFLDGKNQTIDVTEDMVHFLPLVESYKIRGKIMIDRDPNSNEGIVSPEGIRITAVSDNGETFSTLSTSFGTYVLDLPRANLYEVNIYNVFGENFTLERGTYRVHFTENKTINLDFKITEKRRAIQYNGSEQYFDFNIENGNIQQ